MQNYRKSEKFVKAIDLILTNQQNNFLIQWEEKKLDSLNIVKITCMLRFVAKLVLIPFNKYKNRLKNLKTLQIKMQNYLLV